MLYFLAISSLLLLSSAQAQQTWEPAGLDGRTINCLAVSASRGLFAGTAGNGIFRSGDQGSTWEQVFGTNENITCIGISDRDEVFAGHAGISSLVRSHDEGANWEQVGAFKSSVTAFAMDSRGLLYAGAETMNNSEDHGMTWNGWFPFKHPSVIQAITTNIAWEVFAISTAKRDVISRSTNNSNHWDESFLDKGCRVLAVNSAGNIFVGADSGMYRSNDNGDTWKEITAGMGARQVRCIAVAKNDDLFAGTDSGVFRSGNSGATWTSLSAGLPALPVNSLALSAAGFLYAGTAGNGVFRIPLFTTGIRDDEQGYGPSVVLRENSPNPVTSSTRIVFVLPSASSATLKIFDALGRDIATLADEALPAGIHARLWTAGDLPRGLYFSRLQVGAVVETRKMLLR